MERYNLKNIHTFDSRNGYGMTATLLINDIEVCIMRDLGDGSTPAFEVINRPLFDKLNSDIKNLPELFIEEYGCKVKIDLGMLIDLLHYALDTKTEFKILAA